LFLYISLLGPSHDVLKDAENNFHKTKRCGAEHGEYIRVYTLSPALNTVFCGANIPCCMETEYYADGSTATGRASLAGQTEARAVWHTNSMNDAQSSSRECPGNKQWQHVPESGFHEGPATSQIYFGTPNTEPEN
jgi:hypothetical protein